MTNFLASIGALTLLYLSYRLFTFVTWRVLNNSGDSGRFGKHWTEE